jgi:beta-glucosidase/6-phospho-beta-glucosidase/beta-galactosidase
MQKNPSENGDKLNEDQQQQLLFVMLIQQHQQIAMMGMGKIKNPATDKIERDLKSAKYAIDTLLMLDRFTKGNLPEELRQYLNQTLTNLRLNYADEKKGEKDGKSGGESEEKNEE